MSSITKTTASIPSPLVRQVRSLSLRLPTTSNDADRITVSAAAPSARILILRRRRHRWRARLCTLRRIALVLLVLIVCCAFPTLLHVRHMRPLPASTAATPTLTMPLDNGMHAIALWEQDLPENKMPPPGSRIRYLRFLNENWGVGFNNQLQEIIIHAHLAHLANRTYVLPPLNFPRSDAWHPLAAFVRGALAGTPTSKTSTMHAVTRHHFQRACPDWDDAPSADYSALEARFSPEFDGGIVDTPIGDHIVLTTPDTNNLLGLESEPSGDAILRGWSRVLHGMSERCVMIHRDSPHVFDFNLFGSPRVQSLLPSLLHSPVLQDFHWSTLVHEAVQRNLRHWGWVAPEKSSAKPNSALPDTHTPLPRVLALHLRRGDYQQHCTALSAWNSAFLGVNEALMVPEDRFIPPDHGNVTPEQQETFARHCWPEVDDIATRVRRIRDEWDAKHEMIRPRGPWASLRRHMRKEHKPRLNRLYVLTNGTPEWFNSLRTVLQNEGWDVHGSPEMDFTAGNTVRAETERIVGQAADMELAERAEVFIGNGFSSLTANVNLLRLARNAQPASIRFW